MKIDQIEVGEKKLATGSQTGLRSGRYGELIVADGKLRYSELAASGRMFIGANPSATSVTTQAGTSVTTPALVLYNPSNSGIKMILNTFSVSITASPAANTQFFLAYNPDTSAAPNTTTDATIISAMVGTTLKPKGKCYRVSTLPDAPIACRYLGGVTGASSISPNVIESKIDGEIILMPGVAISLQASAAAAVLASCSWVEEDL